LIFLHDIVSLITLSSWRSY